MSEIEPSSKPLIVHIDDDASDHQLVAYAFSQTEHHNDVELLLISDSINWLVGVAQGKLALPDLILLDINMPIYDGHHILHKIKHDEQLAEVPLIIFSGSPDRSDRERALANGAEDYLQKPTSLDELTSVIQALVSTWIFSPS